MPDREEKREERKEELGGRRKWGNKGSDLWGPITQVLSPQGPVLIGWERLLTISPSVSLTWTLHSFRPNYVSKPTFPWEPSQRRQVSPASLVLQICSSSRSSSLVPLSSLVKLLSVTPHNDLAHLCSMHDFKSLRSVPVIRKSFVIAHLFHLLTRFLSPYCVSDTENTEEGKTLSLPPEGSTGSFHLARHVRSYSETEAFRSEGLYFNENVPTLGTANMCRYQFS